MSITNIDAYVEESSSLVPLLEPTYPSQTLSASPHVYTITQTDYVYSTITIPTQESEPQPTVSDIIDPIITPIDEDGWEQHALPFLPAILAFAVIGLLALTGCLIYSAYRTSQVCQIGRAHV